MSGRLLSKHFENLLSRLLRYSEHAGLADHPDVVGLAREGFVRMFLEENLPSLVEYRTGEIIDEFDKRSGQIDLVLQSALSPRIHLFGDMQLALADFVLGIIEVKSRLTTASWDKPSHLKSALETFRRVKTLKRSHVISATPNWKTDGPLSLPNTPCFLVAYHGPSRATLEDKFLEYGQYYGLEPSAYWPEVTVVMDRQYYIARNDGWLFVPGDDSPHLYYEGSECLVGLFAYLCQVIETWNATSHHTNFSKYLRDLQQD